MNVVSLSARLPPPGAFCVDSEVRDWSWENSSWARARLKDSAMGAFSMPKKVSPYQMYFSKFEDGKSLDKQTSGKSTQYAFIFKPYKKLAKLSLKRAKLSCISCKSIMFASRLAIESESSANWGSNCSRGAVEAAWCWVLEERREEREEGRRGVVGRERERVPEGMVAEEDMFLFVSDGVCSCLRSRSLWHAVRQIVPRDRAMKEPMHGDEVLSADGPGMIIVNFRTSGLSSLLFLRVLYHKGIYQAILPL